MQLQRLASYIVAVLLSLQLVEDVNCVNATYPQLLQEECKALAAQQVVRHMLDIQRCNSTLFNCTRCNDLGMVDVLNNRVVGLNLQYTPISGHLPGEWAALQALTSLTLSCNSNLIQGLPGLWSKLTGLAAISITDGNLTGPLPAQWSTLTRLSYLHLRQHQLSSTLPKEWSALTNLRELDLSGNLLTGSLPPEWHSLTHLTTLKLSRNKLKGTLPVSWALQRSIISLDVKENHVMGTLPQEWSSLLQLASLRINDNHLTGTIPTQWSSLSNLLVLTMAGNQLCGPLPAGPVLDAARICTHNKWPGAVAQFPACPSSFSASRRSTSAKATSHKTTAAQMPTHSRGPQSGLLPMAAGIWDESVQAVGLARKDELLVDARADGRGVSGNAAALRRDLPGSNALEPADAHSAVAESGWLRVVYILTKLIALGMVLLVAGGICSWYWCCPNAATCAQLAGGWKGIVLGPRELSPKKSDGVKLTGEGLETTTQQRAGMSPVQVVTVVLPYKGE